MRPRRAIPAGTVERYRQATGPGKPFQAVWWFAVPGGTLASVRRALARHGDARVMGVRLMPAGVTVYTG